METADHTDIHAGNDRLEAAVSKKDKLLNLLKQNKIKIPSNVGCSLAETEAEGSRQEGMLTP